MKLNQFISRDLVLLGSPATTVDEALVEAVSAIRAENLKGLSHDLALTRLRERFALGATCLPSGICVPHARLDGFDGIVIAAVRPRNPLAVPRAPVPIKLIWVIITSLAANTTYLRILAALTSLSRRESAMDSLRMARDPEAFLAVLAEEGGEIQTGLTVRDIMTRDVVSIRAMASVREVLDLMFSHKLRYLPVVDEEECLVGEVGILDLIAAGIPEYAQRVGNLNFLSELEPLEKLLRNEATIAVESVMKSPAKAVSPDTTVLEVSLEMATTKKRHYAVVEKGRLVGVVSSMDILSKVLRA